MSEWESDYGTMATRLDRVRQQLSDMQEIRFWRPEPGDILAGEICGLKPQTGPFGQGYLLLVRQESGEIVSLWLTAYLKAQLESYKAQPGDVVGIRYLGRGTSKTGKQYNRYEVVVELSAR